MFYDDVNDVPPPLEDMSAFLAKRHTYLPLEKTKDKPQTPVLKNVKDTVFSGLKKGFFDAKPIPKAPKKEKIQELRPKSTKNPLIIDQVQEAIKSDWITPDILEKIEKSPILCKAFQDPMFTTAISEMASNASDAFKKYSNQRPDLILALKEFATLMGHELSNAAINQIPKDLPKHEQELLKNVYGNVELQDALKDSVIQKILSDSTKDPLALSRALHQGTPDIKRKIQLLFHAGILSTAM
jgi:hypothetical protein